MNIILSEKEQKEAVKVWLQSRGIFKEPFEIDGVEIRKENCVDSERKTRKELTAELIREVHRLTEQGMSVQEIANILNISASSVHVVKNGYKAALLSEY